MRKLGSRQRLLLLLFLAALIITGLFGVRTVRRAIYWRYHRDEPIRSWMSVRYVARSYRVPPHILYQAIGVEPVPHDRRPLREIAREQNRSVETIISELEAAIRGFRARPPAEPQPSTSSSGGAPG